VDVAAGERPTEQGCGAVHGKARGGAGELHSSPVIVGRRQGGGAWGLLGAAAASRRGGAERLARMDGVGGGGENG
jgi:hypothetical protein